MQHLPEEKFNIPKITSDVNNLFNDKNLNTLVIATRHDSF